MGDVAIIVGASGGIGRALADRLRSDQAYEHVIALSRRLPAGWTRADWIQVDIRDESTLAAAAVRLRAVGQPARIIVATGQLHGSGLVPEKSMRTLSLESLTALLP
jgi:NAD(P)-dependent dehydrogenase (short-subunit alcohol dehydrogenase family)